MATIVQNEQGIPQSSKAKGVGLFMTKTQVESMGGEIHVESEVDKGTTFHICLSKHGNYMIY